MNTSSLWTTTDFSLYNESDYVDEYEDEGCDNSEPVKFGQIFNPVFFSIVVVLSVFGNILVVAVLVKYENLKSITNAFILNLAISDLLFTAGLPFWVYYHKSGAWTLGETACKAVNFVFYVGFYSSGFLLILMTIHRYIAVVSPLSDFVSTKGLYCILAPVVVWLVSIIAAVPYFIFTQVNEVGFCGYVPNSAAVSFWGIYQQIALFILTSLVFVLCYSQIIWRLLRPTGQGRKSKPIKVIFTLMVVFFLGWAPYNAVILLRSHQFSDGDCEVFKTLNYALSICRLGAFSHCCLNPVFYVFVGVKFKNHLMRFVKDLGRGSSRRSSSSVRSRQGRVMSVTSGEEMSL
ncbi:chemokine XC receptor 1-like [Eucyclogobius newberryi]|uniref:chemokine XC receptor 1-like n=1 Tax=Eucyclogobius newberryi TaxID=166745 RepID=UPI003B5C738B